MKNQYLHEQLKAVISDIAKNGLDDKYTAEVAETLGRELTKRQLNDLYADLAPLSDRLLNDRDLDLVAQGIEFKWSDGVQIDYSHAA